MKLKHVMTYLGIACVAIVCSIALTGCPSNSGGVGNDSGPIRVGTLLSLTGTVGEFGQRSLQGIQLAVEEINAKGVMDGRKFEIDTQDTRSEAKDAVSAYRKLTASGNVNFIVGDVYSTTSMAVAPLAESDHVLMLAPGASNPKFRFMGDYIFRNWTSDEFDGRAMADYAFEKAGVKNCGVIYQQVDYTAGLAKAFNDNFTQLGGNILSYEALSEDASDARQVVVKVLNSNPSAIYVCATGKASGVIVKYLREANFKGQIFCNLTVDTPEFMKIAKNYADGIIFSTPAFDLTDKNPRVQKFASAFKAKFGDAPDIAAGHAYDAMYILADAIKIAGSTDPGKVKDALYTIKDFPGVTGRTTFDKYGDVTKPVFIKKFVNGKSQKLEQFDVTSPGGSH